MNFQEILSRLVALRDKGYVESRRQGSTGIGHTLEQELGLSETNLAIPDIGGLVELKALRQSSDSMITLFTFNRAVWKIKPHTIIQQYGYLDKQNRQALYSSVFYGQQNSQKLRLEIDKPNHLVNLYHEAGALLAQWNIDMIVGKFILKLNRLLLVIADTQQQERTGKETFYFNKAYYLEQPSTENFLLAFEQSKIAIDIRMHLKDNGQVRNHGTGIRVRQNHLLNLYSEKRNVLKWQR